MITGIKIRLHMQLIKKQNKININKEIKKQKPSAHYVERRNKTYQQNKQQNMSLMSTSISTSDQKKIVKSFMENKALGKNNNIKY